MVVTLCGSTRFKDEFMTMAEQLTMEGHIVLMPCVFHHADEVKLTDEQKIQLDNLHKEKINMSDAIFVINKDKYIGKSTYGEIDWANRMKKQIYFLENIKDIEEPKTNGSPEEENTK